MSDQQRAADEAMFRRWFAELADAWLPFLLETRASGELPLVAAVADLPHVTLVAALTPEKFSPEQRSELMSRAYSAGLEVLLYRPRMDVELTRDLRPEAPGA